MTRDPESNVDTPLTDEEIEQYSAVGDDDGALDGTVEGDEPDRGADDA